MLNIKPYKIKFIDLGNGITDVDWDEYNGYLDSIRHELPKDAQMIACEPRFSERLGEWEMYCSSIRGVTIVPNKRREHLSVDICCDWFLRSGNVLRIRYEDVYKYYIGGLANFQEVYFFEFVVLKDDFPTVEHRITLTNRETWVVECENVVVTLSPPGVAGVKKTTLCLIIEKNPGGQVARRHRRLI